MYQHLGRRLTYHPQSGWRRNVLQMPAEDRPVILPPDRHRLRPASLRRPHVLGVNIEDLDLAGRRTQVKVKGARAKTRRRGQAREDFVLETVCWDAGTARLLPRLLMARNVRRQFHPSAQAIAEVTALLAPAVGAAEPEAGGEGQESL